MSFGFLTIGRGKVHNPSVSSGRRKPRSRPLRSVERLEPRNMLTSAAPNLGILLLDPSGSGALTRSGNGNLTVTNGDIVIDSKSASAGQNTGNGNVSAKNIDVAGGLQTFGKGKFQGTINKGITPLADPLASLATPTAPSTKFRNTVIGGNANVTLSPGTYVNGIQIDGNATVKLQAGLYYLQGGGLNVGGGAKLTGSGVTIYNAGSGAINVGGKASVTLSAPSSGTYAGIVLFQSRSAILPLNFSGSSLNLTGEVYAAGATVVLGGSGTNNISGNGSTIPGAIIARDLNASGNESLSLTANPASVAVDLGVNVQFQMSSLFSSTPELFITFTNYGPNAVAGVEVAVTLQVGTVNHFSLDHETGVTGFTSSSTNNLDDTLSMASGASIEYDYFINSSGFFAGSATITPGPGEVDTNAHTTSIGFGFA